MLFRSGSGLTSVTASSVNWSNVTNKNVLSSEIANGTIINDDIADNTITNAKILEGTIESGKIKDGTIVDGDINATAGIAFSKLSVTATNIRGLSAYSGGTGVTVNGDGVVAIGQEVATTNSPVFSGMTLAAGTGSTVEGGQIILNEIGRAHV